MRRVKPYPRAWLAGSLGVCTIAGTVLLATLSAGASASLAAHGTHGAHGHPHVNALARWPRAHARGNAGATAATPVVAFTQEFSHNTKYFCDGPASVPPCDGNGPAGDYGTIDRVASHFSNGGFGNYAPSTPALTGGWMAVVSGTGDGNQGAGCPGVTATFNPGETCTGPYAYFGTGTAMGHENVFPSSGFTVTDDLYLSPTTAAVAGSLVDDDVALNNSSGSYGVDDIITACAEATSPGGPLGYIINFGHNSPGSCSGTPVITTDGWYRFVFVFSDVAGNAYVTESVLSEPSATQVATSGPQPVAGGSPTSISTWGGPRYFWLPSEDFSGLPLANFALQLGQHSQGHTP